jgi:hypothetical protein
MRLLASGILSLLLGRSHLSSWLVIAFVLKTWLRMASRMAGMRFKMVDGLSWIPKSLLLVQSLNHKGSVYFHGFPEGLLLSPPPTKSTSLVYFRRPISTTFRIKYTKVPIGNETSRSRSHCDSLPISHMAHAGISFIHRPKIAAIPEDFGRGAQDSDDCG